MASLSSRRTRATTTYARTTAAPRLRRAAHRLGAERTGRSRRSGSGTPSWHSSTRSGGTLARQLDFESIIELVGERVRSIFDAHGVIVGLYDHATKAHVVYVIDGGTGIRLARRSSDQALVARDSRFVVRSGSRIERPTGTRSSSSGVGHDRRVVARRADLGRRPSNRRDRARSWSRTGSPRPTSGSSPPSLPAWAWRWRTPACSTRRSGCSRRPSSAAPSSPSSTRSARRCRGSSTSRRSSSSSASASGRCSTHARCSSPC